MGHDAMRQAFLVDEGFELREVPVPVPGPGEVLIRILANGVCASEVGTFKDREGRRGRELTLGHEASGAIVEVGAGVSSLQPGDAVTVLGGHFADFATCRAADAAPLPPTIEPAWALGEPVACCVHAMDRRPIPPNARVAVVGCGFMGLVCLQLARLAGSGAVTAIDPVPDRRRLAADLGADNTASPDDFRTAEMPDFTGEYDLVVEAAGNQAALDLCGYLVTQHGLLNLVGHHYGDDGRRTVFMNQWNVKAIDVVNGHVRRDDEKAAAMRRGVELAATGRLRLEPLVAPYPLTRIGEAFTDLAGGRPGLVKAVVVPDVGA